MKTLKIYLITLVLIVQNLHAHRDFWAIKSTAIPSEGQVTFTLFFSLEQLNSFPDLGINLNSYSDEKNKRELTEKISLHSDAFIELYSKDRKVKPFVKSINISTKSFDENEESFLPTQVDVDFELVFSFDPEETDIRVIWKKFADNLAKSKIQNQNELPKDALNVNIYFLDENEQKFIVNSENKEFTWKTNMNSQNIEIPVIHKSETVYSRSMFSTILCLVTLACGLLTWSSFNKSIYSKIGLLIIFSSIAMLTSYKQMKETQTSSLPDNSTLAPFMKTSLSKIYTSSALTDNELKWKLLNDYCTKDLSEKIYIENFSDSTDQVTRFTENLEIKEITQQGQNQIECTWEVTGLFQHLSHIHEKRMKFKGLFTFAESGNRWLIDSVSVSRLF